MGSGVPLDMCGCSEQETILFLDRQVYAMSSFVKAVKHRDEAPDADEDGDVRVTDLRALLASRPSVMRSQLARGCPLELGELEDMQRAFDALRESWTHRGFLNDAKFDAFLTAIGRHLRFQKASAPQQDEDAPAE
jgi:hypothetical protein